ncbi:hypothetical protein ABOONEI_2470 [Aciduliprofundum boonei T469]|nr:hypothetical protein ABOONEI_2470 [Aciduliprofundum boonei T469]
MSGLDWVHKTDIIQKPDGTIFLPKKAVEEFIKALKEASK